MVKSIQAIRGMNDILPAETFLWQKVEKTLQTILANYGYDEIRSPILEKTELFHRSIGDVTDIVEKEMYTFADRNNDSLTLRPEGSACCVRAGIEHGLLYNQIQRLWYQGPYFRYERPQKGRYRQFHQCGVEAFGMAGPEIDAEVIAISARILTSLGLNSQIKLQLNSLGSPESRAIYRKELVAYFTQHIDQLDEDSKRRLSLNPLRILDSKNPALQEIIGSAPQLLDYLDTESSEHFTTLQKYLRAAGIDFSINQRLVRGLDYYTRTVFEWVTDELGAQGTVCAGGRFDGLVGQLGGKATPAIGFALGMERTILLMQKATAQIQKPNLGAYFITEGENAYSIGLALAEQIRNQLPTLSLQMNCSGGNIKAQFKKADKSNAQLALVLGQFELEKNVITIKSLRDNLINETTPQANLITYLTKLQLSSV